VTEAFRGKFDLFPKRFSVSLKNFFLKIIKNEEKSQNNLNLLENRTKLNDLPQLFDLL